MTTKSVQSQILNYEALARFQENFLLQAVLKEAKKLNLELYPVGGCVRDTLLGKLPEDGIPLDTDCLVVSKGKQKALDLANALSAQYKATLVSLHPEFGIYRVVFHSGALFGDITLSRTIYVDIADALENSLEKDLARRDLTINALALDLETGNLIDRFCGQEHLSEKRIQMVSKKNLLDDPLRMLRVFRFAAQLESDNAITIDNETLNIITDNHQAILSVAGERIQEELFKIVSAPKAFNSILKMAETGLLETIFPEMIPMRKIPPNGHHHLGLFEHTLELVKQAERLIIELPESEQAYFHQAFETGNITHFGLVKLACLFHDLGKLDTMEIKQTQTGERFTYYGHDQVSAEYTEKICNRFKIGNKITAHLMQLTRWHLYPCQFGKLSPRRSILKFYRRMQDATPDVLLLALADRHSTLGPDVTEVILQREHENLCWLLENYRLEQQTLKLPPLLNGHEVMQALSIKPGPQLKKILNTLQEAQQLGEVSTKETALEWIKNKY